MQSPKNKFLKLKIIFLLFLFFITCSAVWYTKALSGSSLMQVSFLDVGQGDAILVRTPRGGHILIDAGRDAIVLSRLGEEMSFLERSLDVIIGTHSDSDHIGGMQSVVGRYTVDSAFLSLPFEGSGVNKNLSEFLHEKNVAVHHVTQPQIIQTDDGVRIEILFPVKDMTEGETNNASVVTKIIYGNTSFLLTGDLPQAGELFLVERYGERLRSDILKLGHHGSDTSTHPNFLQKVKPKLAVISAGKNNSFGHPHTSVLDLLQKFNIPHISTAESGTITLTTDGISIWQK